MLVNWLFEQCSRPTTYPVRMQSLADSEYEPDSPPSYDDVTESDEPFIFPEPPVLE